VGCIPSKALLHAAKVIAEAAEFGEQGIEFGEPKIDLAKVAPAPSFLGTKIFDDYPLEDLVERID